MKAAFYLGVHGTEPERTIRALMDNRGWLLENGVEPIPPSRHRGLFEEALAALSGGAATPEMEEVLLDSILDSDDPQRIIISQPALIGVPARCLAEPGFFAAAGPKMVAAANLFPGADAEFFMALRNPATLIPFMLDKIDPGRAGQLMAGRDPESMRWAPAIRQILQSIGRRRLVLWCHEDSPLIWPEVLRRLSTIPADVPLRAGLAALADVLTDDGMTELRAALKAAPRLTIDSRRDIFSQTLERHARRDAIETTIILPGWTQDRVDRMTAAYDEDVAEIAALPGVEFIAP
ncbi:hypothetical protein KTN05_00810 [Paracoccus sp. Z118]|uniref:hypothetical protein n=1 Tax=Paracoccus sp. Z118 TaxID=2851017 RepID=UPI001C2B7CC8|nr:hypothetical protein [Paracoccus sp. Z118]MBV0890390.1 hypothetical protein [Paracoccus sp. Z118]